MEFRGPCRTVGANTEAAIGHPPRCEQDLLLAASYHQGRPGKSRRCMLVCSLNGELLPIYFSEGNNYHVVELWKGQSIVLRFGITWSMYRHTYSEMSAGVSIQAPTQLISTEASLINTIPNVYNGSFSIPGPGCTCCLSSRSWRNNCKSVGAQRHSVSNKSEGDPRDRT